MIVHQIVHQQAMTLCLILCRTIMHICPLSQLAVSITEPLSLPASSAMAKQPRYAAYPCTLQMAVLGFNYTWLRSRWRFKPNWSTSLTLPNCVDANKLYLSSEYSYKIWKLKFINASLSLTVVDNYLFYNADWYIAWVTLKHLSVEMLFSLKVFSCLWRNNGYYTYDIRCNSIF